MTPLANPSARRRGRRGGIAAVAAVAVLTSLAVAGPQRAQAQPAEPAERSRPTGLQLSCTPPAQVAFPQSGLSDSVDGFLLDKGRFTRIVGGRDVAPAGGPDRGGAGAAAARSFRTWGDLP
jgi:hypothetical protein